MNRLKGVERIAIARRWHKAECTVDGRPAVVKGSGTLAFARVVTADGANAYAFSWGTVDAVMSGSREFQSRK